MNAPLFLAGAFVSLVGVGNLLAPEAMFRLRHRPVRTGDVPEGQSGFVLWRGIGAVLCVVGVATMLAAAMSIR
jgi:formamidopyrimidine-DNA glycosylase